MSTLHDPREGGKMGGSGWHSHATGQWRPCRRDVWWWWWSSEPALTLTALALVEMVAMVSSASPPRVSATRGSTPEEQQAERLEASLRWTPTWTLNNIFPTTITISLSSSSPPPHESPILKISTTNQFHTLTITTDH